MPELRTAPSHYVGDLPPAGARPSSGPDRPLDSLGIESIKNELQKLAATNQELLKAFNHSQTPLPGTTVAPGRDHGTNGHSLSGAESESPARLRKENEALRRRVAELEEELRSGSPDGWAEQQQAFEQLLDEKSDVIRTLNLKIEELSQALCGGPRGLGRDELEQIQEELELRQQRLQQDEEALQQQLREMEMAMARERADLARQKSQLQRMHSDLQREVELAGRDTGLRDRLAKVQNLATEGRPRTMAALPEGGARPASPAPRSRPTTMAAIDLSEDMNGGQSQSRPGFFRRLFGS